MKVLDVQQFHEGLHRNIEKLDRLEEEIQGIKQAVEELVSLEDALKGEGGNAIRSFYQECHLPLLDFFISFKSHFAETLRRIGEALDSFEPDRMGYIRQEFLEGEVQAGLEEIRRITGTLTDESNSIMDSVADIVSLPHLDDSEVQEGVRSSERQRDSTIEGLMEFDQSQSAALSPVAMDLKKMEQWIIDVESMMTGGLIGTDFPAESWKAVTARHPLRLSLTAHDASVDGLSNMSGLIRPNTVSGANSYPVPVAIAGETNTYNLSESIPDKDEEGIRENSVVQFLEEAGEGAMSVGKGIMDFLFLEDLETLTDPETSSGEKVLAGASLLPVGKLIKGIKLGGEILGISNAADGMGRVGKGINSTAKTEKIKEIVKKYDQPDAVSKEELLTKPKNSPNPRKWIEKGGRVYIDKDGTWIYQHSDGHFVRYPNGFPDFKEAGFVKQEINIGRFESYNTDFKRADELAPNGPRDAKNNTWHHHQDGKTMQEINKEIHKEYTHRGGMALKKRN
ncbi:T7SS effector LXG polymorphic toxin [Bhargavaea beijingensis]|uniref:LXG domain-containing protein n=1 Tax=Bhargavaea beijingensis TaxID=426756 RepID=A0ABX9ZCS4_9BACL|nr:T7SS effector LXG polymorphic toxin [Bhargavaea beijingensis]RSK31951.1 hypothetical protein EJA12_08180 [Bhargavaea beijingensis]